MSYNNINDSIPPNFFEYINIKELQNVKPEVAFQRIEKAMDQLRSDYNTEHARIKNPIIKQELKNEFKVKMFEYEQLYKKILKESKPSKQDQFPSPPSGNTGTIVTKSAVPLNRDLTVSEWPIPYSGEIRAAERDEKLNEVIYTPITETEEEKMYLQMTREEKNKYIQMTNEQRKKYMQMTDEAKKEYISPKNKSPVPPSPSPLQSPNNAPSPNNASPSDSPNTSDGSDYDDVDDIDLPDMPVFRSIVTDEDADQRKKTIDQEKDQAYEQWKKIKKEK